jgi:lipopolysaccharide/colanic/teichoic acid biosynthesis glycosyltransferase
MYKKFGKRIFDILISGSSLIIFSPLLFVIALLARMKLGSPVLFRQERPGKKGVPFTLVKFRTMTDARDKSGVLLPDGERLVAFGRLLRATSLDELPELWNILKGEMSLVGPRPLLMQYLPYYTPRERMRMDVAPGLTGWAQINGRNTIDWDTRLELDAWYVENCSFLLDLKILFLTVAKVVKRSGVQVDSTVALPYLDAQRKERASESADSMPQ